MSEAFIADVEALEAVVGKTPPAMHLKVIDHLDAGALRWIARSPLAFAGFGGAEGLVMTLAGGAPGFAGGERDELRLPLAALDDSAPARPGASFGSLFLLPGIGESLRVNGQVVAVEADHARIRVDECYGHCAKALIRSQFWAAAPSDAPADAQAFATASRFLALATLGAGGHADLSPKGDPAGGMALIEGDVLWFADRPGNRRVDSFRNIVEQPSVALALLTPGAVRVAVVRGHARLTTDAAMRARFAVNGKVPLLAIRVEIASLDLHDSPALARADLWPVRAETDINPTRLFVEHLKLNRTAGLGAALARASVAILGMTGLMQKGLEKDYKDNLY
ncbi:MAG TPA: pyridoxamine 5'-phosphate oxidase family protein [Novosphingobium sp.]|nr:pyridoxamine 5'-phosphate oxidase family protein [Novosphingobium sp.]